MSPTIKRYKIMEMPHKTFWQFYFSIMHTLYIYVILKFIVPNKRKPVSMFDIYKIHLIVNVLKIIYLQNDRIGNDPVVDPTSTLKYHAKKSNIKGIHFLFEKRF